MNMENLENDQFFLINEIKYLKELVTKYPNDYDLGNAVRKYFDTKEKLIIND